MSNIFLSLLRNDWAIDPTYANAQLPFLEALRNGKVDHLIEDYPKPYMVKGEMNTSKTSNGSTRQKDVMVIPVTGVILRDGNLCTPGASFIASQIIEANNNADVGGIILALNTPGGEDKGAFIIANAINQSTKPVIAHISFGMAASAGYWIASQCTEIYVEHEHDEVGSIGAFSRLVDTTGEMEQKGWKVKTVYAPQSTRKNEEVRQALEGDDTLIESRLENLVNSFHNAVRSGRGEKLTSDEWESGAMYDYKKALKIGLIDGKATLQQVANRAHKLSLSKSININKMSNKLTTLVAFLAWNGLESTSEGIHLSIEDAEKIDARLQEMANIEAQNASLASAKQNADTQVAQLQSDLTTAQADALAWQGKYNALQNGPAPDVVVPVNGDVNPTPNANTTIDPVTAEANRLYNLYNKK